MYQHLNESVLPCASMVHLTVGSNLGLSPRPGIPSAKGPMPSLRQLRPPRMWRGLRVLQSLHPANKHRAPFPRLHAITAPHCPELPQHVHVYPQFIPTQPCLFASPLLHPGALKPRQQRLAAALRPALVPARSGPRQCRPGARPPPKGRWGAILDPGKPFAGSFYLLKNINK